MSLLVTPIPEHLHQVLDSSNLARLGQRVRGTRSAKVGQPAKLIFAPPPAASGDDAPEVPNEPQPPKSVDGTQDPVTLLSADKKLSDTLVLFTQSYGAVTGAFSDIFSFPFLETLANDPGETGDAKGGSISTRQLFLDGNHSFYVWCDFEKQTCRNLVGYATLLSNLLKQLTPADFAKGVKGILSKFADQIDARNQEKADIFLKLLKFIASLKTKVKSTTDQVNAIAEQIENTETALDDLNVGKTLLSLLKNVFQLDGTTDEMLTKLAFLLGVTVKTLTGDFGSLYREKSTLTTLLRNLQGLQRQLELLNHNLGSLATALEHSVEANDVLAEVWAHVSKNLDGLASAEGAGQKLSPTELNVVLNSWETVKGQANAAIAAISSAMVDTESTVRVAASVAPTQGPISMPKIPGEFQLFNMAVSVGSESAFVDSNKFNMLKAMATTPAVAQRTHEKLRAALEPMMMAAALGVASDDQATAEKKEKTAEEKAKEAADQATAEEKVKEAAKYLGPPTDVQESLQKLAGDCGAIVQTFSNVLQIPYTDQLQIINPFKTMDTPNLPATMIVRDIILAYQKMYQDLQNDSVECIRRLIAYSAYQIVILPKVNPFKPKAGEEPKAGEKLEPGQVSLDVYLAACKSVVATYSKDSSKLSARYTKFNQDWRLCQDNLKNAIATAKEDAERARKALQTEKDRYKNSTINGVLEIFGALAMFAVGAFIGPLALLAVAVPAGYLLGKGISELQGLGQIDAAIDAFQAAVDTSDRTAEQLKMLEDPMQKVAEAMRRVTTIWNAIVVKFTEIETAMISWDPWDPKLFVDGVDPRPMIFMATVDSVIDEWGNVKSNCEQYIGVITGSIRF